MVSNSTSVTAVPARTPAPSAAEAAAMPHPRPLESGKDVAPTGEDLPVKHAPSPPADVAAAVRRLNELMEQRQRDLSFHVDEASGRTVITVLDAVTSEVVRQIPSEEVLALARVLEQADGRLDARV